MLVEYVFENGITEDFVNKIVAVKYLCIEVYADVTKALLWCEVYHYLCINGDVIAEGDSVFNNKFALFGIGDITGLLQVDIFKDMCKFFNNINECFERKMNELRAKLPLLKIEYKFLDIFFKNTCKNFRV